MDFILRQAGEADLSGIMTVMDTAARLTEPKEWFVSDDADYVKKHLTDAASGFVLAAEVNGTVAAFFMVHFPGLSENNLGRELGFSDEQLLRSAHMDSAAVLPGYRGHKLQARLCLLAEEELKKRGFRHLLCTVHPDNRFSLENMQKNGYEIKKTMLKYGGLPRHILLKTLP